MDRNYLSRVTQRRALMAAHPSTVTGVLPDGHAAVMELYVYLLGTYLPTRYPRMFGLRHDFDGDATAMTTRFINKVTGLESPLVPPPRDSTEALRILGETVEDDLFFLHQLEPRRRLPDQVTGLDTRAGVPGGEHTCTAFLCCHPAGFDPPEKLGKGLREIHGPVPGYERIGPSMERFFARVEVGGGVRRVNVSCFLVPTVDINPF